MLADTLISRPKRWDTPFGPDMTDENVDRVIALPLLADIDAERFSNTLSLRNILKHDSRIIECKRGDIVVREGDYGHSVFFPMSGNLRVITRLSAIVEASEPILSANTQRGRRTGLWAAIKRAWFNPAIPEVRKYHKQGGISDYLRRVGDGTEQESRPYVSNVEQVLETCETVDIDSTDNDIVGEIAALTRSIRTASIFAETNCTLLELRWQGLRDIRKQDRDFRIFIDDRYRDRAMLRQLQELPLLQHLDRKVLEEIIKHTLFESYGDFEWNRSYQKADQRDWDSVIEKEPIVAEGGHYTDGLLIVCAGFGRVSDNLDRGERTLDYLSRNGMFGLEELAEHWHTGEEVPLKKSLRAIGYLDILRIPTALVEKYILPNLPTDMRPHINDDDALPWEGSDTPDRLQQSLIDFFINNRTINGSKTMLINTSRCVNCDDCVRACAVAHNNNPRFVQHGPTEDNIMIANACMHCVDPVCLIGCPTGAIQRDQSSGNIIINDTTCIGCGTCASSCPYDNIQLVEIRDVRGSFIHDADSGSRIVKATKCDLCQDLLVSP
ncbi:MAG TPA: 4Fe-4S dicluster domain-containing protein, partial [Rhodospirillales bacterium]|nr:4Fe-4S dicluster domain-containing protein [Rhodospirillales bacterium]